MTAAHQFMDAGGDNRRLLVALDGRIKLGLLAAALGVNLTAGGLRCSPALLVLCFFLVRIAGVRASAFAGRMIVPSLLALVALLTQLFWFRQGQVLLGLDLGLFELLVTRGGLERGMEIALRILGGMGVLLFFSLTTPLPELMRAVRFFRCPPVLVELALIMYRYIFLLLEEAGRIRAAQKARLGFIDFRAGLRSSGILGGMLVLRTCDRAERSFEAMRCRGYTGALPQMESTCVPVRDWLVLALGWALLAVFYVLR